jgi:NADH:ubiquinone oxidoreductase subunit F (NADH-binding)
LLANCVEGEDQSVDVIGKLESDEEEDDELDQYEEFFEKSLNDLTCSFAQIEKGCTI